MSLNDPQVMFIALVLPGLFAMTLIGDGLNKMAHYQSGGTVSMVIGIVFIALIVVAYFYYSVLPS